MTEEVLKHVQVICREWLDQAMISGEQRLTILPAGPLLQAVEVELRSVMAFDNTTISSAVDVATGAKYVSLIKKLGWTIYSLRLRWIRSLVH